jgi:hypothetical protein
MLRQWEITWEGEIAARPDDVWETITRHAGGYLWPVEFEPWVGGAERGLGRSGGLVTVWEPPRRFATATRPGAEALNELTYELEPLGAGTYLRYVHRAEVPAGEFDLQHEACRLHTAFYLHSLGQHACHFAGRDAAYVSVEATADGSFAALRRALGVPDGAVRGDRVRLEPEGIEPIEGVVDYATGTFLGIRAADALYRVYGRDTWGWPTGVALHLFADGADPAESERAWSDFVAGVLDGERVVA